MHFVSDSPTYDAAVEIIAAGAENSMQRERKNEAIFLANLYILPLQSIGLIQSLWVMEMYLGILGYNGSNKMVIIHF